MTTQQYCPYCNQPMKKVGDVWICPIHGRVLKDIEKEEKSNEEIKKECSYIR